MFRDSPLRKVEWEAFERLAPREKGHLFMRRGRPYHVLSAQQFDRRTLERLGDLATKVRRIGKSKGGLLFLQGLLADKQAMLYFVQPSTRTFLSFYSACRVAGMHPAEVRDTTTSSEVKGESPEDTVRTFSSYVDLIIMRHPVGGFAERIAWLLSNSDRSVPVINAGSGKDQHPTQALLDIYTLQRSFENRAGIDGKCIAFVGDLARGRTVRSLASLLALYEGVKVYFVAPPSLQIGDDVRAELQDAGVQFDLTDNFEQIIPEADAIYMTRVQDEWDEGGESEALDISRYHFKPEHLALLGPDAVILHPLPRRHEIAPEVDADPRAVYWRQVRNGMWIRSALLIYIFDWDHEIDRYYEDLQGS